MRGYEKALRRYYAGQREENELARDRATETDLLEVEEEKTTDLERGRQDPVGLSTQETVREPNRSRQGQYLLRTAIFIVLAYAMGAINAGVWLAYDEGDNPVEVVLEAIAGTPAAPPGDVRPEESVTKTLVAATPVPNLKPGIFPTASKQTSSEQPSPINGSLTSASKVAFAEPQKIIESNATLNRTNAATVSQIGQFEGQEPPPASQAQTAGSKHTTVAAVAPAEVLVEEPSEVRSAGSKQIIVVAALRADVGAEEPSGTPAVNNEASAPTRNLGLALKKSGFIALAPTNKSVLEEESAAQGEEAPVNEPAPAASSEPAETPQETPKLASPPVEDGFMLQVAAVTNPADANAIWKGLKGKFPDLLDDLALYVEIAEVNGKVYHRVQTGPFEQQTTAQEICARLKAGNQDCLVKKTRK